MPKFRQFGPQQAVDFQVAVRFTEDTVRRLDGWRATRDLTRAQAVRLFVADGLAREGVATIVHEGKIL